MPMMLVEQSAAWGSDGHRMINRLAAANLPNDVPLFLRSPAAQDAMDYYGPEPDRWRGQLEPELSAVNAADHFMDMEWADLIGGPLPRKRYDFIRALAVAQKEHPDIPLTPEKQLPKIHVLSVAPLLADAIKRIHFNESVSKLFE